MPAEVPTAPAYPWLDWLREHPVATVWIGGCCFSVSTVLIIRMWFFHRRAGFFKKLWWTLVLLLPFVGWLFYGALFQSPGYNENQCPTGDSQGALSGGP